MSRRLVFILIALVGTAGVVVAGLSLFFSERDRTTLVQPGPVRSVEVDVEAGRVEVVPGGADEATITRTRRYLVGAPATKELLVDGVLTIEARCGGLVAAGCGVDYRIEVPAGVPVRIRTDRASVSVVEMSGMVEVTAGAGDVRLHRTRGPVRVETSAGTLEGVDIVAEYLDATTAAGAIRLSLALPPGRLGLTTGAGDIDVTLPAAEAGYRVVADTGSGTADVGVVRNEGGSRAIIAKTGSGTIRVHPR